MRRMAGKLGCGGGRPVFLFSPCGGPQTQMLQEQVSDQRHQGMSMQTAPRAALEVVEPKLFLHLLMRLLADPTRFDRRGQLLQLRVGRQVGEIVLALALPAMLAHQPDLIAGKMLSRLVVQANRRPVGHPHAHGGKPGPQRSLGAVSPGDLVP
jgi:hypothetical protein